VAALSPSAGWVLARLKVATALSKSGISVRTSLGTLKTVVVITYSCAQICCTYQFNLTKN
jgi:hypothetical protein